MSLGVFYIGFSSSKFFLFPEDKEANDHSKDKACRFFYFLG